jgi:uncharacterized protein (DUF302 family)
MNRRYELINCLLPCQIYVYTPTDNLRLVSMQQIGIYIIHEDLVLHEAGHMHMH